MSPYRKSFPPEITIVGVEADPFPQKRREIARARMRKLLLIERAANRLIRTTREAADARDGFPDAHELRDRCEARVMSAFSALQRATEM